MELGLGMTQKTINQYPQSQIIENFFSIDETELHYKNYAMKRIPIIQCRVNIIMAMSQSCKFYINTQLFFRMKMEKQLMNQLVCIFYTTQLRFNRHQSVHNLFLWGELNYGRQCQPSFDQTLL